MNELTNYNPWLVLLSFAIASLAALSALDLAGRMRATRGAARYAWMGGGALAMGTGIWSMHFIGMLAMEMAGHMRYDLILTLVSMLAAVLTSELALLLACAPRPSTARLAVGGIVMGGGVCLMHYLGMEAMETRGTIIYTPGLFWLSVLVAVTASTAALWLTCRLNPMQTARKPALWLRFAAALVMGVGIAGMHYTGMAAADMSAAGMIMSESALSPVQLAVAIAIVSGGVMVMALLMAIYDGHLTSKAARLTASLREANRELKSMVSQDPLTRLPNRLLMEQHLEKRLRRARRSEQGLAVLFVDLDRFKTVNDSMGHHIGDQLLKLVAVRLEASTRESDTVARIGGDEFIVVTGLDTSRDDADALAQRITQSLGTPFQIQDQILRISCSVGISLYPGDGDSPHDLIVHADAAMYHAKDMGRNNLQFYESGMSSVAERRNLLEQRLRIAIEQDTLTLAYQPKVNVDDGEVTGVEALLRWNDDELGQVSPEEIIPIAEDTGLILPIGEWVLRSACQQVQRWHAEGLARVPVAVNLSAIQLNHKHFINIVERVLEETELPPAFLELELTESAIMHDPDNALRILRKLHKLGVSLSIDDFGTGYSNLSQLKRFPIHQLKVDRSFTAGVATDLQDAAIVKAVFMLAQSLNLNVVAEGVETDEQLEFIRGLKGEQYQGYLYSKPLAAAELAALLRAGSPTPVVTLISSP